MQEQDRLIQGMAAGGDFRIIAAQTTDSVREVTRRLDLSPVAAIALGRALTGATLLARLLDKHWRHQKVSIRFDGGGPAGIVIAEAAVDGSMRGTIGHPHVTGDLDDIGAAIGRGGMMTVVRATPPTGRPYTSQTRIESGEIATDLTSYLAHSEQIPSAVLLGVRCRPDGVSAAGGMVVQAFPHAQSEHVELIEQQIRSAPSLSELLETMPIEDAVREVLGGVEYKQIDSSFNVPLQYRCSCSRERALASIGLFGESEISDMISSGGTSVSCHFCGEQYEFSSDDLLALGKAADA